ncbi:MAG: hypothetical protein WA220_07955 [Candidatus Nitrosopolaris sp.]
MTGTPFYWKAKSQELQELVRYLKKKISLPTLVELATFKDEMTKMSEQVR